MLIGLLLIVLYVFTSGIQMCLNKVYQSHVENTLTSHFIFLAVMSFFAALSFAALAGFDLSADAESLRFALTACFAVVINQIFILACLSHSNLTLVTIAGNAGNLLWPSVFGVLFLHESITWNKIVGICLILLAVLVPVFFNFDEIKKERSTKEGYLLLLGLFLVSGHGSSVHKAFTVSTTASASSNAYLSWVNIFMFPLSLLALYVLKQKKGVSFKKLTEGIDFKWYGFVAVGTVIACFGMPFYIQALTRMEVSLYSPLYSSIYMIFMSLMSKFVFHENLKKDTYIAAGLAMLAVIFAAA